MSSTAVRSSAQRPRVVIVGGGFGGLAVARAVARSPVDVVLVDRRNYHLFQPLLYQVATAGLSPADIAQPIRRILRDHDNTEVVMAEIRSVDLERRVVAGADLELRYDYLVLAAGATHTYFGHDEWSTRAPGLKTVDDALEIRRRVLAAFEAAEIEDDRAARRAKLTFVVVGGGPTGVELAGALREIAVESIPKDFRRVDTATARIILVEGSPRLLGSMSAEASDRARRDLEKMGVEVRLDARVTEVDDAGVMVGDERIAAQNVVWAAGVRASRIGRSLGVELDAAGRVVVGPDCAIPGHPEAFVIGDQAAQVDAQSGEAVPGVAQGALQMGDFVGGIIHEEVAKAVDPADRPAFRYVDKGSMATIGKAKAVADVGGRFFGGLVAWILWSIIHVAFLIGLRAKVFVVLGWIWSYVVHTRGARLITGAPAIDVKRPRALRPAGSQAEGDDDRIAASP